MRLRHCERRFLTLVAWLMALLLGIHCAPAQSSSPAAAGGRNSDTKANTSSGNKDAKATPVTASQWGAGRDSFGKTGASTWGTKGSTFDGGSQGMREGDATTFGYKAQPGGIWRVVEQPTAGTEKSGTTTSLPSNSAAGGWQSIPGLGSTSGLSTPLSKSNVGMTRPNTKRASFGRASRGAAKTGSHRHGSRRAGRQASRTGGSSTRMRHGARQRGTGLGTPSSSRSLGMRTGMLGEKNSENQSPCHGGGLQGLQSGSSLSAHSGSNSGCN